MSQKLSLFALGLALALAAPLAAQDKRRAIEGRLQRQAPVAPAERSIQINQRAIGSAQKTFRFDRTQSRVDAIGRAVGIGSRELPREVRPRARRYYVVGTGAASKAESRRAVEAAGADVVAQVPGGLVVQMDGITAERLEPLRTSEKVDHIDLYRPAYKITPQLEEYVKAVRSGTKVAPVPAPRPAEAELQRKLYEQLGEPTPPEEADAEDDLPTADDLDVPILPEPVSIAIYLFPNASPAPVQQAIEQAGGEIVGEGRSGDLYKIRARLPADAVEELAEVEGIQTIKRDVMPKLRNDVAKRIIAGAGAPDLALDGGGQIVGHADSGLDIGQESSSLHPDFHGRLQKVFALGRQDTDDWSDLNGHGTHTAASILGNGTAGFPGIAPKAKLVHQSVADQRGALSGLPDPYGVMFSQAYDAGARIHSNSWGVDVTDDPSLGGVYDTGEEVDHWVWNGGQPRDMLIVIAAGNDGRVGSQSVGAPATAKNALAVGATESLRALDEDSDDIDAVAAFSSRGPTIDGRTRPDVVSPGTSVVSARTQAAQVAWQSPVPSAASWQADGFSFDASAGHAEAGSWRVLSPGGEALFATLASPGFALPAGPRHHLNVWASGRLPPSAAGLSFWAKSDFAEWARLETLEQVETPPGEWRLLQVALPSPLLGHTGVRVLLMVSAPASSGPFDLRLDDWRVTTFRSQTSLESGGLAAMGAEEDQLYTLMQGTSMATPIVAGSAAVLRQALIEDGTAAPSAELLKAMLINGADALGPRPNHAAGWGRVNLHRTLQTPALFDQASSLEEGEAMVYTFEVRPGEDELRVTLAWADPPGPSLVNDLDLELVGPDDGEVFPAGAGPGMPDTRNNVEGIDVAAPTEGAWTATVRASKVALGPQPFSIVISGPLAPSP